MMNKWRKKRKERDRERSGELYFKRKQSLDYESSARSVKLNNMMGMLYEALPKLKVLIKCICPFNRLFVCL